MRITPTLFNFTLNPNAGLRLDMRDMFETVARSNEFPLRLNGEDIVDFLQIDTVLACLPGGRGCVGKERLGRTLHDRQVALVDSSGIKYNPARPDAAYGFLHLVGFVQYKDGKQNKIVIPVEPSGVIGLRAGSSSLSAFNPNENLTQNRLLQSISELETILFAFLNIPKRNEPKMAMLNAMFNVFTDKTGKDRPRITNFVRFLRDFYNTLPELKDTYHKGTTPWLRIQGGPTVMKSSFKLKFENGEELQKNFKKDVNSPPTFTISPYGHVEFLGAKSFTGIKTAYNIIVRAARIIQEQELVTFQEPEEAQEATGTATTRTRVKKPLNISKYFPITFSKKDRALFINKKPCDKYPKNFVTYLANINGIPARGKISTVCQRLHDLPQLVQIAGEKEANNKQNKNTIRTKLNRKGVPQTTIDGRQCKTMSKKNLKKYAEKYDIDPTLPVKEICRLLAIAVNKNNNNNQAAEGSQRSSVRSGGTVSTRSGVGSKQKNSVRSGGTVSTRSGVGSEQKNSVRSGGSKNKSLPENPMLRFAGSKQTINFLKVYNPDKSLYELQRIAMNIWTNDMNGEQQNQWIQKHVRNSPVFSIVGSPSGSKKSTPNSAFLHSLYGSNNGASVRSAAVSSRSKKSSVRSGATSRNSDGRSSRKSSARKSSSASSASVNTPNSAFLHSLYDNNGGASVRSGAVSSRSKKNNSSARTASVNAPNSAFLHSLYDNNGGASVRSGAVSSRSKKNNSSVRSKNNGSIRSIRSSRSSNSNSDAAMMRFVTHRTIITRLRNNHPNKSENQLVALAKDAWKNDYDHEARRNWLANHPVVLPNRNVGIDPNSEAAMLRFTKHRSVIGRLQNNHPDKTLNQLVALAKDAWRNDYANRDARLNWLENHDRNNNMEPFTPKTPPTLKTRVVPKTSYYVVEPVKKQLKKVLCASKLLTQLKKLAEDQGVSTQGTKKDICDRIAQFRNAKGRPMIIVPSNKVTERTTLCENKTLKFLRNLAEQMRLGTTGTKAQLCKRMASTLLVVA